MRNTLFALAAAVAAVSGCKSKADEPAAADNTARNKRDQAVTPTADNAVKGASDLDITQKIRKSVMDDSTLSTNAHNCKIVVQNGAVTLVGPVADDAERTKVQQIAAGVVGDSNVTNQLEISK